MGLPRFVDDAGRPLRFPREMLANEGSERLLVALGVEIVDDPSLEDYARAWLATVDTRDPDAPSVWAVQAALERAEGRRAA